MTIRRIGGAVLAAAVAVVPLAISGPAHAATSPITIKKVRTGAASLIAGSGQKTMFTVTIENQGDAPWPAFFADRMQPGLVIDTISASSPHMVCAKRTGHEDTDFSCMQLLVPAHKKVTIEVTAHAPAATRAGTYDNCAGLGLPPVGDPPPWPLTVCDPPQVPSGPEVHAQVAVTEDADLAVTATTAAAPVNPGENATVDVGIKNNGPSDATGPIKVKTTLPTGLTFVSGAAPWACLPSGLDVECTWDPGVTAPAVDQIPVGTLLAGSDAPALPLTVTTAKPGVVASYDVTVVGSSASPDSVPANNTATATINVTPVDLSISKQGSGTFQVNATSTWHLTVSNVGTIDDAAPVTVTDTLAAGLQFVSGTGTGWTCTANGQVVTCTADGLAKGASDIFVVANVTDGKAEFSNTATVSTQSYEQNTSNNSTTAVANATPVDLAITKTAVTASEVIGQSGTWKFTVSNVGTIADNGVITVTDTFPQGQSIVSATSASGHWGCGSVGQKLTCTHQGAMPVGDVEEILVTTDIVGGAPGVSNEATVATTSYEANLTNNTSAAAKMAIARHTQTATPLPNSPRRVLAGHTDQGQKIHTRVRCWPLRPTAAGEVSYCKVIRKGKYIRVKVIGNYPMKVRVVQRAKGTKKFKPFMQKKTYIVRPSHR